MDVTSSALVRDLRAESRALGQAWLSLQDEVEQLERHKNLLRHEWKDLEEERERMKKERERFEKLVQQEWFPVSIDSGEVTGRVVRVNVGGQIFEISAKLLLKDRFSLLAATCLPTDKSILHPDEDGCFFFDRDWFLFRHILSYLQDNTLPKDVSRLRELYHEAGFYCLGSMQRQIKTIIEDIENTKPQKEDDFSYMSSADYSYPYSSGINERKKGLDSKPKSSPKNSKSSSRSLPDPFGFTSKPTYL